MNRLRLVVALGLTGVSTLGLAAAHALADDNPGTQTVNATWSADTWYQPDPTCQTLVGCVSLPLPAVNPYGAGTLHVAVTAGQETARSYLGIKAQPAPDGYSLTGAKLVIPLDTTSALNGSTSPATSKVQVCTSTDAITSDEGTFADPPTTSCAEYAELAYSDDNSTPELSGDLGPILDVLQQNLAGGKLSLGLLPDSPAPTDAWHDVFTSITKSSPTVPPATLTLTYTQDADASATPTPDATTAAPVVTHAAAAPPAVVTGTAPSVAAVAPAPVDNAPAPAAVIPSEAAPAVTAAMPQVAATTDQSAPVDTTPAAAATPVTVQVGFLYPAVLLLPAILLIVGYLVINLMTRDLAPAPKR